MTSTIEARDLKLGMLYRRPGPRRRSGLPLRQVTDLIPAILDGQRVIWVSAQIANIDPWDPPDSGGEYLGPDAIVQVVW